MAKSRIRPSADIPTSSMADIAFLLLIFFLVTTTMNIDKGLLVILPPWSEEEPPESQINNRNVFFVVLNARNDLLVEGDYADVKNLKEMARDFIANPRRDKTLAQSPEKAVISFKNDRGTSYDMYIQVWNELKAAYNELWDEAAMRDFGVVYSDLNRDNQKKVRKKFPMKISEAEPENIGGVE